MSFLSSQTGILNKKLRDGMTNKKDVSRCQETSKEGLGYLEGFEGMTTIKDENKEIDEISKQYNDLLSKYEKAYVLFVEALFYNDYYKSLKQYVKHRGQVIQSADKQNYYINDYGILRKTGPISEIVTETAKKNIKVQLKNTENPVYKQIMSSDDLFKNFVKLIFLRDMPDETKEDKKKMDIAADDLMKAGVNQEKITEIVEEKTDVSNMEGCPDKIVEKNVSKAILDIFAKGTDIEKNLGCSHKVGNIKSKNGRIAFVDMYGIKHEYKDFHKDAPDSCPREFKEVADKTYDLYKKGRSIENKDGMCVVPNLDLVGDEKIQEKYHELKNMGADLRNMGKKMLNKAMLVNPNNDSTRQKLNMHKEQLNKKINKLSTEQAVIDKEMIKYKGYKKEFEDTESLYNQSLVKYSLLGSGLFILGFGVYKFMNMKGSSSSSVSDYGSMDRYTIE
jgi:hypothetical protein